MVKDLLLKIIFIPLLGISLPLISGLLSYGEYTFIELAGANAYFILTSFAIWKGCFWIHTRLRPLYRPIAGSLSRIAAVSFVSALYGGCTGGLAALIWLSLSREPFSHTGVYIFILGCIASVIIFTLVYEILFLTKEREFDTRIVDQLDKERSLAELQALTNEMDPHFIFNSLNTLNHLILSQPEQAHLFNNRLAQVYKYFLINKNRELIPLKEELEFIDNYFYLLRIRYDDKLQLAKSLTEKNGTVMIPPCSLQILVENAIKHNEFTEERPLKIHIYINDHYLKVSNNIKPKSYPVNSTGIGLKNLSARYRILFRRNIAIETNRENFVVKLPLIASP
ncbi:MAG: histidine kinase [Chitinophagaceae bacterium]